MSANSELQEVENVRKRENEESERMKPEEVESDTERERKLTERGKEYQITVLRRNFKSAISAYRRKSSDISVLASDSRDLSVIRDGRNALIHKMAEVRNVFDRLTGLLDGDSLVRIEEAEVIENVESSHQGFLQQIASRICEIEQAESEIRSQISNHSGRSNVSKRSLVSRGSSSSDSSRLAAKAASLKAKLKYIDIEAQASAALQRIRTFKELDMAQAKMNALGISELNDTFEEDIKVPPSLPQNSMADYVNEYLQTHTMSTESSNSTPTSVAVVSQQGPPSKPQCTVPSVNVSAPVFVPTLPVHAPEQSTRMHDVLSQETTKTSQAPVSIGAVPLSVPGPAINVSKVEGSGNIGSNEKGLIELAKSLADQVSLGRLPPPEPSVFSGDPLQYPGWKSSFQILIEQRQIPPSERIHYLKRYIGGSVRDAIEGYFLLPTDEAYDEARKLLDQRFGDPFVVANAFRDKLDKWPKILPRDGTGLQKYADFLRQCSIAMTSIGTLSMLDDSRENRKLITKLPDWAVARWARFVEQWKTNKGEFPPFKAFVDFVVKEARIACDPITSIQSLRPTAVAGDNKDKSTNKQFGRYTNSRSFLSKADDEAKGEVCVCIMCQKGHELNDCESFLAKPLAERKAFIRENSLCFSCLRSGHISRRCWQRKKCKTCSRQHPTSLHGDVRSSSDKNNDVATKAVVGELNTVIVPDGPMGTVHASGLNTGNKCSMIVPVYVSHQDNPDRERLVYALLDTQSDTTFILDNTCDSLGLSGPQVKLSLSTMHAENKIVNSRKIKGLMVRGFDSESKIALPVTYTRCIMPANRSHIPTPELAKLCPRLHHVAEKLVPLSECEIGMLIGYNCPRALVPREVVTSYEDGPYGQRTDLGWGIVGVVAPDCAEDDSIGVSHRVLSCEVPSPLTADGVRTSKSVLFSLRTAVKEIVSSDVLRVMEQDFRDSMVDDVSLSREDQSFLNILDESICFKDGHYEMPLPFRAEDPSMPDNRGLALKRLQSLKKRLNLDETLRRRYSDFMNDLLKCGYAERVPESDKADSNGRVWYIPHHGVYHSKKPDKLRVVFDCSATFHGECLNSHLLHGPDLTNRLVGVLTRFRKEPVAIVCDVEKMFYQFKVTPCHRNYLRFLWWDSDDFTLDPIEYRMTVHLFGATSSPGCANFGFKRIASDGEGEFGVKVADFIRHDFYVDDGLKSVETVAEAVGLIEKGRAMCSRAGLRLHKFVSNSKDVVKVVPPEDRANALKELDLACDKLPIDRTLGVLWCIESDTFQFRMVLNDRPLTRRGILSTVSSVYDPLGFIAPVVLVGKQILQQMCADQADWDDPPTDELRMRWTINQEISGG